MSKAKFTGGRLGRIFSGCRSGTESVFFDSFLNGAAIRKKRIPAWQGTQSIYFTSGFNSETLEYD
jgi:hypothetical protein